MPYFPEDESAYVFVEIPEEAADFMAYVGFGVINNFENEQLDMWISTFDWENHSFAMPNYEVFTGGVAYYAEPKYEEGIFMAMYTPSFTSDSYWGFGASGFMDGEFAEAGTASFPMS